jgi:DNA-directed RNA polymerase I, II, and III subunit RPABC1
MDNLTKLFRIRKTCLEMLRDREYLVSDDEISRNKDSFREQFGENPRKEDLTIMMPKQSDLTEQVRRA